MSVETAIAATLAAASGLHHVHEQGILHRDVKAENLMFDRRGALKVTDFGIARVDLADATVVNLTHAGEFFGTPAYVSPEQAGNALAEGWPPVGAAADQYSLAAVLYEALSGYLTHDTTGGFPRDLHPADERRGASAPIRRTRDPARDRSSRDEGARARPERALTCRRRHSPSRSGPLRGTPSARIGWRAPRCRSARPVRSSTPRSASASTRRFPRHLSHRRRSIRPRHLVHPDPRRRLRGRPTHGRGESA